LSPLGRSLVWLRRQGFIACPVERWLPRIQRRADAFGFADILAASPQHRIIMLVQATTVDHLAGRVSKAKGIPELRIWLKSGGTFEAHGWAKKNGYWRIRRIEVSREDMADVVLTPRRRPRPAKQPELF
jgi:hypothetical protein